MKPVIISELICADDDVLLAKTEEDLQHNINCWSDEMEKRNMQISLDKTKNLILSRESKKKHYVKLKSATQKQVETFKYLGTIISHDGRLDEEINTRIASTGKLHNMLNKNFINKKEICKKTKLRVSSVQSIYLQ
jgi:hypothetical protein